MPVTWSRKGEWNVFSDNRIRQLMFKCSYGFNLFSRPFFGVLMTIMLKPNVSLMVGPRFGRGIGNQGELTKER